MAQAWEKREKETNKAYQAFCAYLELGLRRSLVRAYQATKARENSDEEPPDRIPGHWSTWSRKHDWVSRAAAYDAYTLSQGLEQRATTLETLRQTYIDRAAKAIDMLWEFACGERKLSTGQRQVLEKWISRAGVIVPRQLEISGRDGGPLKVAAEGVAKLDKETLRTLKESLAALRKKE